MTIDSFKFLPRVIARFYQLTERTPQLPLPFVRPKRPLASLTISLLSSAGLYLPASQPPFDLKREKAEPTWGDPSWRLIPSQSSPAELAISHLHINPTFIKQDVNVALPLERLQELADAGIIGGVAPHHISLMGYQGFPPDSSGWEREALPQISARLQADQVDGVVLVPTWPDCCINVPGLARQLEAAGFPTVLITPMPYWAEKVGVPRTLAVEHPFGQVLGSPGDKALQRSVLQAALQLLTTAVVPGTQVDHPSRWPVESSEAQRQWQPVEPSPIIDYITPRFRELLRQKRRSDRST